MMIVIAKGLCFQIAILLPGSGCSNRRLHICEVSMKEIWQDKPNMTESIEVAAKVSWNLFINQALHSSCEIIWYGGAKQCGYALPKYIRLLSF